MSRTASGVRQIRKILIVDDDEDARGLLGAHFAQVGYHVSTASDGNEAIAVALEVQPDVIVLDLSMPRLDGWDAARLLHCYPTTSRTPLIACTAVAGDQALDLARAQGCWAVVLKPCMPVDVERAIDALLDAARSHAGAGS